MTIGVNLGVGVTTPKFWDGVLGVSMKYYYIL